MADPATVKRMMGGLAAAWGGLDVLVSNAGVAGPGRLRSLTSYPWLSPSVRAS